MSGSGSRTNSNSNVRNGSTQTLGRSKSNGVSSMGNITKQMSGSLSGSQGSRGSYASGLLGSPPLSRSGAVTAGTDAVAVDDDDEDIATPWASPEKDTLTGSDSSAYMLHGGIDTGPVDADLPMSAGMSDVASQSGTVILRSGLSQGSVSLRDVDSNSFDTSRVQVGQQTSSTSLYQDGGSREDSLNMSSSVRQPQSTATSVAHQQSPASQMRPGALSPFSSSFSADMDRLSESTFVNNSSRIAARHLGGIDRKIGGSVSIGAMPPPAAQEFPSGRVSQSQSVSQATATDHDPMTIVLGTRGRMLVRSHSRIQVKFLSESPAVSKGKRKSAIQPQALAAQTRSQSHATSRSVAAVEHIAEEVSLELQAAQDYLTHNAGTTEEATKELLLGILPEAMLHGHASQDPGHRRAASASPIMDETHDDNASEYAATTTTDRHHPPVHPHFPMADLGEAKMLVDPAQRVKRLPSIQNRKKYIWSPDHTQRELLSSPDTFSTSRLFRVPDDVRSHKIHTDNRLVHNGDAKEQMSIYRDVVSQRTVRRNRSKMLANKIQLLSSKYHHHSSDQAGTRKALPLSKNARPETPDGPPGPTLLEDVPEKKQKELLLNPFILHEQQLRSRLHAPVTKKLVRTQSSIQREMDSVVNAMLYSPPSRRVDIWHGDALAQRLGWYGAKDGSPYRVTKSRAAARVAHFSMVHALLDAEPFVNHDVPGVKEHLQDATPPAGVEEPAQPQSQSQPSQASSDALIPAGSSQGLPTATQPKPKARGKKKPITYMPPPKPKRRVLNMEVSLVQDLAKKTAAKSKPGAQSLNTQQQEHAGRFSTLHKQISNQQRLLKQQQQQQQPLDREPAEARQPQTADANVVFEQPMPGQAQVFEAALSQTKGEFHLTMHQIEATESFPIHPRIHASKPRQRIVSRLPQNIESVKSQPLYIMGDSLEKKRESRTNDALAAAAGAAVLAQKNDMQRQQESDATEAQDAVGSLSSSMQSISMTEHQPNAAHQDHAHGSRLPSRRRESVLTSISLPLDLIPGCPDPSALHDQQAHLLSNGPMSKRTATYRHPHSVFQSFEPLSSTEHKAAAHGNGGHGVLEAVLAVDLRIAPDSAASGETMGGHGLMPDSPLPERSSVLDDARSSVHGRHSTLARQSVASTRSDDHSHLQAGQWSSAMPHNLPPIHRRKSHAAADAMHLHGHHDGDGSGHHLHHRHEGGSFDGNYADDAMSESSDGESAMHAMVHMYHEPKHRQLPDYMQLIVEGMMYVDTAILRIQRYWRLQMYCRKFHLRTLAAILIQRYFRMWRIQQHYIDAHQLHRINPRLDMSAYIAKIHELNRKMVLSQVNRNNRYYTPTNDLGTLRNPTKALLFLTTRTIFRHYLNLSTRKLNVMLYRSVPSCRKQVWDLYMVLRGKIHEMYHIPLKYKANPKMGMLKHPTSFFQFKRPSIVFGNPRRRASGIGSAGPVGLPFLAPPPPSVAELAFGQGDTGNSGGLLYDRRPSMGMGMGMGLDFQPPNVNPTIRKLSNAGSIAMPRSIYSSTESMLNNSLPRQASFRSIADSRTTSRHGSISGGLSLSGSLNGSGGLNAMVAASRRTSLTQHAAAASLLPMMPRARLNSLAMQKETELLFSTVMQMATQRKFTPEEVIELVRQRKPGLIPTKYGQRRRSSVQALPFLDQRMALLV
ncbi:hypothetical protein BC831DRAFT_550438 [Entophlyctis helioformis]|nr:hypothetical protein BC831DRAFT_550438 [Entophlyctis helioformis]